MVEVLVIKVLTIEELGELLHIKAVVKLVNHLLRRVAEHVQCVVVKWLEGLHHYHGQVP